MTQPMPPECFQLLDLLVVKFQFPDETEFATPFWVRRGVEGEGREFLYTTHHVDMTKTIHSNNENRNDHLNFFKIL